jgi:hypothetical protein
MEKKGNSNSQPGLEVVPKLLVLTAQVAGSWQDVMQQPYQLKLAGEVLPMAPGLFQAVEVADE